jgi:D-beta-D-heptose 7-phosphate kinase/D-beta-D-heptose 1-phosphate adenosyltransferase
LGKGDDNAAVEEAARELKKKFSFKAILLTRSAFGMTLLDEHDNVAHYPAIARSVFDVTGAGDTVVAVLAASIARGANLNTACILAMSAASVVVGKVGTATASFKEIESEIELLEKSL